MLNPGGVLGEIVARKLSDLRCRFEGVSCEALAQAAQSARRTAEKDRLKRVLALPRARFILEIKRKSPTVGWFAQAGEPETVARAYQGVADAMSVLTDEPFFGGSVRDLAAVRGVFGGPILAKDFFIDARQIHEAALAGADAVLVMLSVLEDHEARALMVEADALGLDALVEVHDEKELGRALDLGADLIGVNNRDLRTLGVDLSVTERLAPRVGPSALLVSESGIRSRADVRALSPLVDGFLVGASLLGATEPALAARALVFGPVKICGLMNARDAARALSLGASVVGSILAPGRARTVDAATARAIADAAHAWDCKAAGVFANQPLDFVIRRAQALGLDIVQLHGDEPISYAEALKDALGARVEVWLACGVTPEGVLQGDVARADCEAPLRPLFDTALKGEHGGTGQVFNWNALREGRTLARAVLAGGLDPANVEAASKIGAWALDVSTGVERAPGRKDEGKLQAFFEALRTPARGEEAGA